jgi:hypothetical protein
MTVSPRYSGSLECQQDQTVISSQVLPNASQRPASPVHIDGLLHLILSQGLVTADNAMIIQDA